MAVRCGGAFWASLPVGQHGSRLPTRNLWIGAGTLRAGWKWAGSCGCAPRRSIPRRGLGSSGQRRRVDPREGRDFRRARWLVPFGARKRPENLGIRSAPGSSTSRRLSLCLRPCRTTIVTGSKLGAWYGWRMSAAILCIGTELTRGELQNSNATWLAESLTTIGFEVLAVDCVDDDRERIEHALTRLSLAHDVLVCTGGLGPTTDDITTECAARLAGVPLQRDAASLDAIRERLARFNLQMAVSNAKQADFPVGARILANPNGTAPGFELKLNRALSYFMPGVPFEMKAMFE